MKNEFDVIIIGAGHNGLTCGAYLSKTGLRVLVLESRDVIGGGCDTREVTLPGFQHNLHSFYHLLQGPFSPYYELELQKYGARYIYPDIALAIPFREGKPMFTFRSLKKTCERIALFSKKDAEQYRRLKKYYPLATYEIYSRPLTEDDRRKMLSKTKIGQEYYELTKMNSHQLINECFEDSHTRMSVVHLVTANRAQTRANKELTSRGIMSPGGFFRVLQGVRVVGIAVGGSISLAKGLANLIYANNGIVMTRSKVSKILVKDGVATGVVTSDGRTFHAKKAVVSAVDHVQTLLSLVGADHLDRNLVRRIENWIWAPWTLFGLHLALNAPPTMPGDKRFNDAAQIVIGYNSMKDYEEHFKYCDAGMPPENPGGPVARPTLIDPSQAPAGKHTLFLWQFVPYELKDGGHAGWEKIKYDYAQKCIQSVKEYMPNVKDDNILGVYADTPVDTEHDISDMVHGDAHQGSYTQGQEGYGRPDPELSQYRTPIRGLYLCGSCTHPGGSVTMAPGYNAANVITEDLGIKKWWRTLKPEEFM